MAQESQVVKEAQALDIIHESQRPGISREKVIDYYAKWVDNYEKDVFHVFENNTYKLAGQEMLRFYGDKKDVHVLDCAAGTGYIALELKRVGFTNMDALDPSAEMLEKAKDRNLYHRMICDFMGPHRVDIEDATYDVVLIVGAFLAGHMDSQCFDEIIRVLKPGGRLIIINKEITEEKAAVEYMKSDYLKKLNSAMQTYHDKGRWIWKQKKQVDMLFGYPLYSYVFEIPA